mmetsp:Transcript_44054/g.93790  ORF Transcript_44054/g.93790 Transcript_44054/m.93790 type:complete len:711 (+) Transcript_44054:140-2272(+)
MAFTFGDDEPDWAIDDDEDDPFGDPDDDDDGEPGEGGRRRGGGDRFGGAEHLLFLFDCDDSMFEPNVPCRLDDFDDDDEHGGEEVAVVARVSAMDVAVASAHRLLRTKVRDVAETRGGKRDSVGVLLYGCDPRRRAARRGDDVDDDSDDDDSEGEELPPTHELIELRPPGIEQVLTLQECRPSNDPDRRERRDLRREFSAGGRAGGPGEEEEEDDVVCSLLQGLTAAQKIFGSSKHVKTPAPSSKQLPDSKTVWIFTNQDDPCRDNEGQRTRMDALRKDCRDADIAVHVLPLPRKDARGGEGGFDRTIFYDGFTTPYKLDQGEVDSDDGVVDVEAVVENFAMGTRKRRKYATLPLLLPGWKERPDHPGIMLDLYSLVQVRSKPQKITVHQEKNKATTRKTSRINAETGEVVEKEDIHHFADFCGRVSIQPSNLAKMKRASNSLEAPGLLVHGFRPMKLLPTTNLMSKTVICVANESRVSGSEKALYNLKQSMMKKGVFAVGELLLRATATSNMVAFVPKADGFGGFLIVQLPFREDTRNVPQSDIGFADRNAVDAAKDLISKTTLNLSEDFESCLPENPWLKHFFGYLESVSLGRALGEVEDDARMDADRMLKNAAEEIESFSLSLPEDEGPAAKERKRKAPPSSKPGVAREGIGEEWFDRYENDELGLLKNDELKAFLKSRGERVAGKKADLVDRATRVIREELSSRSR